MSYKRLLSLAAAIAVSITSLAACSDSSSSSKESIADSSAVESAANDTSESKAPAPIWETDPAVKITVEETRLVVNGQTLF